MSPIRHNQRRIKDVLKQERHHHWKRYAMVTMASFTGIAIAALSIWSLNQALSVKHWNIHASTALKPQVEQVLSHMEKLDFWHARPSKVRAQILTHVPDIADVSIQRQLPDTLDITIIPRQPIALWLNPDVGNLYLVDEQGFAYRARQHGELLDLPILRMEQAQLSQACQWLVQLKTKHPHWFAQSSEIFAIYNGWKINLSAGQQWQLPLGQRAIDQTTQITTLLEQPRWHAGNWRIDTRLANRWFLRPATHEGVI